MNAKNTNRAEDPFSPTRFERAFVMPSDLRDDVRYVGFVERGKSKALSAEVFERCADKIKFFPIDD